MPRFNGLMCVILAAAPLAGTAQSIATNSPVPLSTRVVSYQIDARLDTDKKSLDATEVVTYKNLTGQPLASIPFHLYLNAFRPQSSFTSETHFTGGIRDSEKEDDYPKEKLGEHQHLKDFSRWLWRPDRNHALYGAGRRQHARSYRGGSCAARIRWRRARRLPSDLLSMTSFRSRLRAMATSAISSWADSGIPSRAFSGMGRGIAISITRQRSSSQTLAHSMCI